MADTVKGDWPNACCSDCGKIGCVIKHWGPLVPGGESGSFCVDCFTLRKIDAERGNPPKQVGYKRMGKYTKKAYEGAISVAKEVIKKENFLMRERSFLTCVAQSSWWLCEASIIGTEKGFYIVFHGYQPSIYGKYFSFWIFGPYEKVDHIDLETFVERLGSESECLFTEFDDRITFYVGHPFGKKFRGMIESGLIKGSREDQIFSTMIGIIS